MFFRSFYNERCNDTMEKSEEKIFNFREEWEKHCEKEKESSLKESSLKECSFVEKKISYPEKAVGWVDNIYHERVLSEKVCEEEGIIYTNGIFGIRSLVWTETEETGFGVYPYEETTAVECGLENANYEVSITLTNPTGQPYKACIKANNMTKENAIEVDSTDVEFDFKVCIIDGILQLKILPEFTAVEKEQSSWSEVWFKNIRIRKVPVPGSGEKPTLYLLSDSTVQTYDETTKPQTGWGQVLVNYFVDRKEEIQLHGSKVYETEDIIIDNCAIGGRSSKSFIYEGRLDQVLQKVKPGDFVFVQFGHNDATAQRPNRYVPAEIFDRYLTLYINGVKQRGATCVLVTPVARRNCEEGSNEFKISFQPYRNVMFRLGKEYGVPVLDLGKESTDYLNSIGGEKSKELYMWVKAGEYPESKYAEGVCDNTHLQEKGASIFAGMVVKQIKEYREDQQLDGLKQLL